MRHNANATIVQSFISWQRSNLGLAASIPKVFFAAFAVNSQVWWLFSYGLGCHLDSWTFWVCGLWCKCQCRKKCISILGQGWLPAFHSGKLRCRSIRFMQDGAPCHTAKKTKDCLAEEWIKCLPWPSQSPDMNPVEDNAQVKKCQLRPATPQSLTIPTKSHTYEMHTGLRNIL